MMMEETKEIAEIPYPEEFRDFLNKLTPILIESLERDGIPVESGLINIGKIDKDLRIPLFFFYWVSESNEIIDNLNIILSDLRNLPSTHLLFHGSPRKRYYLLIRTFFYEFYRFREIFNQAVKSLQIGNYIVKAEMNHIRKIFHEAFEDSINLRNNMVHGTQIWMGERHFNLMLVGSAMELGFELKDKETGELLDIREVLKDLCDHGADTLRDEGNRMSEVLKAAIKILKNVTTNA